MLVSNGEFVDQFETAMLFDNCEAVTLSLKPMLWDPLYAHLFEEDFRRYCRARQIDYVLYPETGKAGNNHYHGIMIFPFGKIRKNFQVWFNKYFGKYYQGEKGDGTAWHYYCTKQSAFNVHREIPYLFDPLYEV